jgi:hypothetical protein
MRSGLFSWPECQLGRDHDRATQRRCRNTHGRSRIDPVAKHARPGKVDHHARRRLEHRRQVKPRGLLFFVRSTSRRRSAVHGWWHTRSCRQGRKVIKTIDDQGVGGPTGVKLGTGKSGYLFALKRSCRTDFLSAPLTALTKEFFIRLGNALHPVSIIIIFAAHHPDS